MPDASTLASALSALALAAPILSLGLACLGLSRRAPFALPFDLLPS